MMTWRVLRLLTVMACLALLAGHAHAAPVTLTWECEAGACVTYAIYRDIGCLDRWVFLRHIPMPTANVMTPPAVATCWRIVAVNELWEEGGQVTVRVVVRALPEDAASSISGYVVAWKPGQAP